MIDGDVKYKERRTYISRSRNFHVVPSPNQLGFLPLGIIARGGSSHLLGIRIRNLLLANLKARKMQEKYGRGGVGKLMLGVKETGRSGRRDVMYE